MNEKIKQLAEQARDYVADAIELGFPQDQIDDIRDEKFAELIIRECGKVIVNGGYRNPALGEKHPLTPPEIAKMIKQHFGVEE